MAPLTNDTISALMVYAHGTICGLLCVKPVSYSDLASCTSTVEWEGGGGNSLDSSQ